MNENNILIRGAQIPGDYIEIKALWQSAGPGIHLGNSDELTQIEKKMSRDPDLFLVAETEGKIIGSVLGGYDGRRGLIYHLVVSVPYRQNGIGGLLMQELEKRLYDKGCIRSYLLVTRDNNDARSFYSNHGWEQMDLCIMAKDLV